MITLPNTGAQDVTIEEDGEPEMNLNKSVIHICYQQQESREISSQKNTVADYDGLKHQNVLFSLFTVKRHFMVYKLAGCSSPQVALLLSRTGFRNELL